MTNDELNPDFPVVTGNYQLTAGWRVQLPLPFNRRIEDGSMVLWNPELTVWIDIWHNDRKAGVDELLEEATRNLPAQRRDEQLNKTSALALLTYELTELAGDLEAPEAHSVNACIAAPAGLVQVCAYFDSPEARLLGLEIIRSISVDG